MVRIWLFFPNSPVEKEFMVMVTIANTNDRLFSSPNQRNGAWPLDRERASRQQQQKEACLNLGGSKKQEK